MKRFNRLCLFLLPGIIFGCSQSPATQTPGPSLVSEPTNSGWTAPTQPVYSPWGLSEGEGFNLQVNFLTDPNTACVWQLPFTFFGDNSSPDPSVLYLSCLDRDGWHVYDYDSFDNPDDPGNTFYHQSPPDWIGQCPDGRIYLDMFGNKYLLKDGILFNMGGTVAGNLFACAPGNGFWSSQSRNVSHFDGNVLTDYPFSEISGRLLDSPNQVISIAVAPNADVWVAMTDSIATFNDTGWQVFEDSAGFEAYPDPRGLAVDAAGNVWVFKTYHGLLKFDGDQWSTIPFPDGNIDLITVDGQNNVWVKAEGSDDSLAIYQLDPQTNGWAQKISLEELNSLYINGLQFDRQGRLWVATNYGLYVYTGSGWTAYHTYNSGLSTDITMGIIVLGDGPELPAPLLKEPGSIRGKLVLADRPADSNLYAEICLEQVLIETYFGATPCADQAFHAVTPLDADGNFIFTDVPVGKYFLIFEVQPRGWKTAGKVEVLPGEAIDFGEILYPPDSN
jgi:hypothetical protein